MVRKLKLGVIVCAIFCVPNPLFAAASEAPPVVLVSSTLPTCSLPSPRALINPATREVEEICEHPTESFQQRMANRLAVLISDQFLKSRRLPKDEFCLGGFLIAASNNGGVLIGLLVCQIMFNDAKRIESQVRDGIGLALYTSQMIDQLVQRVPALQGYVQINIRNRYECSEDERTYWCFPFTIFQKDAEKIYRQHIMQDKLTAG